MKMASMTVAAPDPTALLTGPFTPSTFVWPQNTSLNERLRSTAILSLKLGSPRLEGLCRCGSTFYATSKFCLECGAKRPEAGTQQLTDRSQFSARASAAFEASEVRAKPTLPKDVAEPTYNQPVEPTGANLRPLLLMGDMDFQMVAKREHEELRSRMPDGLSPKHATNLAVIQQHPKDQSNEFQRAHAIKKELQIMLGDIGHKMQLQWGRKLRIKLHHACRQLDINNNGRITRDEIRQFCAKFGWAVATSDQLYFLLCEDNDGEVSWDRMTQLLLQAAQMF